jgi:hypothetical protein
MHSKLLMFSERRNMNYERQTKMCNAQCLCLLQSPQQYLRHHEHVVLDPAFSPSEPSEIFHSDVTENGKRRASDR